MLDVRLSRLTGLALICGAGLLSAGVALAQSGPPTPDLGRLYGTALVDGANLEPAEQRVIAFIGGRTCGVGSTLVAPEGDDDVGKTVFVVDVLADGSGPGQRPGCGTPGDPITLYFPESGRIAPQAATFASGIHRANVSLETLLGESMVVPFAARDGSPE